MLYVYIGGWASFMNDFLPKLCFEDEGCLNAGWISWLAITANLVSVFLSLFIARLTDILRGHLKISLLVLNSLCAVILTLLSLITLKVVHFPEMIYVKVAIYVLLLASFTFATATIPLSAEFAVEICYPAAEGVVTGWLTIW